MSRSIQPATEATRARMKALAEEPLSLEEWRRRIEIPLTDDERERTMELVRWFRQRYPTPAERLAYARRAYKRWAQRVTSTGAA